MTERTATHQLNCLAATIDALHSPGFSAALLDFIASSAAFDSGVVMGYPDTGELLVVHNALHSGDQPGFGGAYRDGLWLLSPLYLSAKAGLRGSFHIVDIAPPNFSDSTYYALYYNSNGVLDHSVFLLETGDGTPLAISMERTPALAPFSTGDKASLQAIAPVVAALARQNWPAGLDSQISTQTGLHQQVQQVLSNFGSSLLTPRERDVVQLVLRGLPSKAVARELGISSQTEQVHRKNIYQKLGLSSHNALFSLFFDALVHPCTPGSDPLVGLSRRQAPT